MLLTKIRKTLFKSGSRLFQKLFAIREEHVSFNQIFLFKTWFFFVDLKPNSTVKP